MLGCQVWLEPSIELSESIWRQPDSSKKNATSVKVIAVYESKLSTIEVSSS